MKTKLVSLVAVAALLLTTGCAFNGNHSGNVLSESSQKMLQGIPKGDAIKNKTIEVTDNNGLVSRTVITTSQTDPENYLQLAHHELDVARDVAVAQAKAKSPSWLERKAAWLFDPTPGYCNGGSGSFTTSSGEGGRNVTYSTPGGFPPHGIDGGNNFTFSN